jgi:formate dehydrogenase maturation protein FdhE
MKVPMGEMQEVSRLSQVVPLRHESCPLCGSDGVLESAMIRLKEGALGYVAGLVYHCPACGTAWPLCGENDDKKPIEEWVKFSEFYEGFD